MMDRTLDSTGGIALFLGELTHACDGWEWIGSRAVDGMTYNEFEGLYPDQGGKLLSPIIRLDHAAEQGAYYRLRFTANSQERAFQGIEFYDADGGLLPDLYDVIYAGGPRSYDRVFYAMPAVTSVRILFQSTTGMRVWDLSVEHAMAEEAAAYCDVVYREVPPLRFTPPPDAMTRLPRTIAALKSGQPWHVVMLGDSNMNDTFHSQFYALLKREFPASNFIFQTSVRGATGCWFYCKPEAFRTYVAECEPDLLVIGGVSNYQQEHSPTGTEAMSLVVRAAQKEIGCEVLLTSGALSVDTRPFDADNPTACLPVVPWSLSRDANVAARFDPATLEPMAKSLNIPLWDLATPTYSWLYSSGRPYGFYSRDESHSGELGKQIIGRALLEYFKTAQ